MTATATRPRRSSGPPPAPPRNLAARLGERRTLLALLASALGVIPLKGLFSDWAWLLDVWVTMLVVIGPAALLRLRRTPGALDIWPGTVLLVPWLTARFVPHHAFLGFVPTRGTWHDVSLLLTDLHHTTRTDVAPIHTTVAVRLVVCALLGLLTALVDLVAVVGRRGALAGVPLLIVYTVSGAVPRHPVSWVWFTFAALGFLVLLGLDAGDDLNSWGRRIRVSQGSRSKNSIAISTPRIVAAAIVIAIVLPLLVPGQSRNLIANAFHGSHGDAAVGTFGGGGGGSISPFAALQGQLNQPAAVPMATVHIANSGQRVQPFYMRVNVLQKYTGDEWTLDSHGDTAKISSDSYPTEPLPTFGELRQVPMRADISILGFNGNAPIFTVPSALDGLDKQGTTWSSKDQILLGSTVSRGDKYTEDFDQPAPTIAQLRAAPVNVPQQVEPMLELPSDFPAPVKSLVARLTSGASSPYDRARAISNFFADPRNKFTYSLTTDPGDSGSYLVDFLKNRTGFCQQYAAAMGVMLRAAGIPSRVVLGYIHDVPDDKGNFTVTTSDAHSWVEAYFAGVGWIPFDPTPAAGLSGGAKNDLAWAPHDFAANPVAGQSNNGPGANRITTPGKVQPTAPAKAVVAQKQQPVSLVPLWWALGALALIALILLPAAIRTARRRRRYLTARRSGAADALWAELSDTAVDLGYVWSAARSPRQVATWLSRDATDSSSSLRALAVAVEHDRYSPAAAGGDSADFAGLSRGLRDVAGELRSGRSRGTRVRAALWPASLGWGSLLGGIARRRR